jgi:hypothetical protein
VTYFIHPGKNKVGLLHNFIRPEKNKIWAATLLHPSWKEQKVRAATKHHPSWKKKKIGRYITSSILE